MFTMPLKRLLCLGIFTILLSGCGLGKSEPTITPLVPSSAYAIPVEPDDLKYVDCPAVPDDEIPPEMRINIQCASLSVPEDWREPDGVKIQIMAAIVKTPSENSKPDPVLVFLGNPGFGTYIAYALPFLFEGAILDRDYIIIDQRGTGNSQPSIDCPELNSLSNVLNANLSLQEANDQLVEASSACAQRVRGSGVDLTKYTTADTAADLEKLRQALGISQWNIYSFINGSRLALTMMREYPHGIRSVVLDSPVPLQVNPAAEWGANVVTALDNLFQSCAADIQCFKAFPNLKQTFFDLLGQLDAQPIQVEVADLNSGERYKVMLDSERLMTFILGALVAVNDRETLPEIPRMIYQLQNGKTEAISRLMGRYPDNLPSSAMGQWKDCNEEFSFFTLSQVTTTNDQIDIHLQKYFNTQAEGSFLACEAWKTPGINAVENQAVSSGVPSLLMAGELDWLEPPSWAELAANTLRSSTVVTFSGAGQVVSMSGQWTACSHQIVGEFLEDPSQKPNTSCAATPLKITWITMP
jgi:pimeloyl-ACP methyl ester carboxylesterase